MSNLKRHDSFSSTISSPTLQKQQREIFSQKYKAAFNKELEIIEKKNNAPDKIVVNIYGVKSNWM